MFAKWEDSNGRSLVFGFGSGVGFERCKCLLAELTELWMPAASNRRQLAAREPLAQ